MATRSIRLVLLIAATALAIAACGDDDAATTTAATTTEVTTTAAPATTTTAAPATTTTTTQAPTTTEAPADAITVEGTAVAIDWSQVSAPFFAGPVDGAADPFYHLHTDPGTDGFFLSIEAYTVYGTQWTGELGTFEIDCTEAGTGICVHFDPDGPGPEGDAGADFLATGTITFHKLGAGGMQATLENVTFTNGLTIAGPLQVTG